MRAPIKNKVSSQLIKYFSLFPILIVLSLFLIPDSNSSLRQENGDNGIVSELPTANVPFLRNVGQMEAEVDFYADIIGGRVFITRDAELVYSLNTKTENESLLSFKEQFYKSNQVSLKGEEESDIAINLFKGHDPAKWLKNIPAYKRISFNNIFDGVDLYLEAHGNNIEKVFKINSGTSPTKIKVIINGADQLNVGSNGDLIVRASGKSASFTKPVAFQVIENEKYLVSAEYIVTGTEYGFELGEYNTEYPVFIDPLLASTYLGGSQTEKPYGPFIEVDDSGYVYICGFSSSTNFPRTPGVFQSNYSGGPQDCFISKFNNDLTKLIASTYLGGSGFETECTIELDDDGNVYVGGYTNSTDFPTTPGSYNQQNSGDYDIFISKLSNDLSTLIASTYIGGSNEDGFHDNRIDLEIGNNGDLYFVGQSTSEDFPVTPGAFDTSFNGTGVYTFSGDVVVVRFDNTLSNLVASTFLGGTLDEFRVAMALDSDDNVFVVTGTYSWDIQTTGGAYDPSYNGGSDLYISKLSSDLSTQIKSTYFGGSEIDVPHVAETDLDGNLYISGYTDSPNFPTKSTSFDPTFNGNEDGFVIKFDNNLQSLLASTFIGGSQHDRGQALKIRDGKLFLTGKTLSSDFPIVPGTYDDEYAGGIEHGDIFVSTFDLNLSTMFASTYLGGAADEKPLGLAVDDSNHVFVGGFAHSGDYPFTTGAYDSTFGGVIDVIVAKLLMEPSSDVNTNNMNLQNFRLYQNYPNPFNPNTIITYSVAYETETELIIYNSLGEEVRTLVDELQPTGTHSVVWDAKSDKGEVLPSGIYIYSLKSKEFRFSKKMILIK